MKLYARESERETEPVTGKVSCLGPEGSFSEYAAQMMCPDRTIVLCPNFSGAVRALLSQEVDCAVLPVENTISGGVLESLDLLETSDVFATKEYLQTIDQRLAMLEGVKPGDVENIYSHEQALRQCAEYIAKNFPRARCIPTSATVESLAKLDRRSAGIVGAHVRRPGVVLSKENIADNKGSYTRFLMVERFHGYPARSVMVFFCAVCTHKPGSLLGLLKIFQRYSLNLTRIESRPVKDEFGAYRFFIEIAGDIGSERVKKAFDEARAHCPQVKILGAYD